MSKRKVQFAEGTDAMDADLEEAYMETDKDAGVSSKPASQTVNYGFKEKHSLDSDEEDNVDKYDMLNEDDIEGQEDTKVDIEDGVTFTPFNMKEELEEGHFDTDGMYIYEKDKNAIKDNWMDNIDWVRVKESAKDTAKDDDDDDDTPEEKPDELASFREMLTLMKPGETVLKSLRRLGGGKSGASSASQRWKAKKQKTSDANTNPEDKENLLKLTGLADRLLSGGDFEIYQSTYEKLSHKVKVADDAEQEKKVQIPDDADDDDALDMFADDIDKKTPAENGSKKEKTDPEPASSTTKSKPLPDEVQWEYKWEAEDEEIHGPFSSSQMAEWQEDNFFKDGVMVRKVSAGGDFYSSRRIDFELYT